jgi:uncharacterized protein YciW
MPAAVTDVMDALAGIKSGSALDAVRNRRPQAREQAEASFRALFEPESFAGVSATERCSDCPASRRRAQRTLCSD